MVRTRTTLVVIFAALLGGIAASAAAQSVTVTDLFSFSSYALGNSYATPVQSRSGLIYSNTTGSGSDGSLFDFSNGGVTTYFITFNTIDGAVPSPHMLLGSDGNLYGADLAGGTFGYGVLFRLTPAGKYTKLHEFNGGDGEGPFSLVEASDGNIYGVTKGGAFFPTLFKYTPAGVFSTLYTFDNPHGVFAQSIIQAFDGNLLVTSLEGGTNNNGTIVELSKAGKVLSTYKFPGGVGGSLPMALVAGSDGNYYGVTNSGGQTTGFGYGTVFRYTPQGTVTILYALNSPGTTGDGTYPFGIVQASDGFLYGTTTAGGANNLGSLFRISTSGAYTSLYSANAAIGDPYGAPMQDTNGLIYMAAIYDGPTNNGTYHSGYGAMVSVNAGAPAFAKLVQNLRSVGQQAQILGQGFTGTTSVTFNGISATSFKVVNDTYVTATVPSGAKTGPVVVTTPTGTLTSFPNMTIR